MNNKINIIYKVLTPQEWEAFQKQGYFKGSPLDIKDGFIHTALERQYPIVLEKFFKDTRPLILAQINPELLAADTLVVEPNRSGGDEYPHIYGAIPLKAVIAHEVLE